MADNDYGLFWNSVNGDRKYDADSFEIWAKKFFTTGVFNGDLQVTADGGMNVLVGTGYCCVEGKVKFFDTAIRLQIMNASGVYPRIDNIVIERDDVNRWIVVKVQTGALSGHTPVAPAPIRENGIYQIVLAQVYVSANATEITQADITDKRADNSVCGWVVGTVNAVDVAQMTAQAQADFDAWYENIRGQLSEDAAGHLQNEIDEINGVLPTLVPIDSPALTGTPTTVTPESRTDRTTQIPTTEWVMTLFDYLAPITSPYFHGHPTMMIAPDEGDSSNKIPTTAWVQNETKQLKEIFIGDGFRIYKTGSVLWARFMDCMALPTLTEISADAMGERFKPIGAAYYQMWDHQANQMVNVHQTTNGNFDRVSTMTDGTVTTYRLYGVAVWVTEYVAA